MSEKIARSEARTMVAIRRNLVALLLLRNASPPPPKTGDSPVPGACSKIAATSKIETTTCKMVITIAQL